MKLCTHILRGIRNDMPQFLVNIYNIYRPVGTRCDCKTNWLWVRSPLEEMKYLLKFIFPFLRSGVKAHSAALSSATQHAIPPEFGRKLSGTECLNTRLADFLFFM